MAEVSRQITSNHHGRQQRVHRIPCGATRPPLPNQRSILSGVVRASGQAFQLLLCGPSVNSPASNTHRFYLGAGKPASRTNRIKRLSTGNSQWRLAAFRRNCSAHFFEWGDNSTHRRESVANRRLSAWNRRRNQPATLKACASSSRCCRNQGRRTALGNHKVRGLDGNRRGHQ